MGSPNFYTNVTGPNFAIESESFQHGGIDDEDQTAFEYFDHEGYEMVRKTASEFEQSINTNSVFHRIKMEYGYQSGFQLHIVEEIHQGAVVEGWERYKELYDYNGNIIDVSECEYFRKGTVNVTPYTLKHAVKKEFDFLVKTLTDFAYGNSMGEIVGKTWTSSVDYEWLNK